jgi:hypothetical protein
MRTPAGAAGPSDDPSGPLVVLCAGHRCAALRELTGGVDDLRSAIRQTPGGVLVSAGCLGPCHLGALAVVARRDGPTGTGGPVALLSGVDRPTRAVALRAWVLAGGPTRDDSSPDLPRALAEAVFAPVARAGRLDGEPPPSPQS